MPHTFSSLLTHIVYSTKDRRPLIAPEIEARLFSYCGGTLRLLGGKLYAINGTEDHIHLLAELPPSLAVAEAAGKLKGSSSHWINETFPDRPTFAWQRGYGAFSVSKSHIARVAAYISGQKAHHEKRSFLDEFQELLKRHDVACSSVAR